MFRIKQGIQSNSFFYLLKYITLYSPSVCLSVSPSLFLSHSTSLFKSSISHCTQNENNACRQSHSLIYINIISLSPFLYAVSVSNVCLSFFFLSLSFSSSLILSLCLFVWLTVCLSFSLAPYLIPYLFHTNISLGLSF